jgi:hypothetical protein
MIAERQEPSRRRGARAVALPAPRRPALALLQAAIRRPGQTLFYAAGVAFGLAICINALMLQGTRHPAPLFAPAPAHQAAPLPPPRPVERVAAAPAAPAPQPAPATTQATPAAQPVMVPRPVPRDAIGELLKGNAPAAAQPAAAQSPAVEATGPAAAAQRALTRLGYGPLRADGVLGSGTRAAIERFERDRKIPVTGELNPRTIRELSVAAGMPIE